MARVYEARLSGVHGFVKRIAIKMMLPAYVDDEEFVTMLIDEAKIAAALNHSNICQIHDLGRIEDTYYIAMEYVEGADLNRVVNRSLQARMRIPFDLIAHIGHEVCSGLHYAHSKTTDQGDPLNIIHRDISPANILISNSGEVKIVDFGVAKAASRTQHTMVGVVKGKYQYMSPEQITGKTLDHRSDIFAVGIVLYESIAGQMMYPEGLDMLDRIRLAKIRPLKRIRPDVPDELNGIIKKALSRNADDRYQDGSEMGEALEEFLVVYRAEHGSNRLDDLMQKLFTDPSKRPPQRKGPQAQKPPDRPTKKASASRPTKPVPGARKPEPAPGVSVSSAPIIIEDRPRPAAVSGRTVPRSGPPVLPGQGAPQRAPAQTPTRPIPPPPAPPEDRWTVFNQLDAPQPSGPAADQGWRSPSPSQPPSHPTPPQQPPLQIFDEPKPHQRPPSSKPDLFAEPPSSENQLPIPEDLPELPEDDTAGFDIDEPTIAFDELSMSDLISVDRTNSGGPISPGPTITPKIISPSISSNMSLPVSLADDTIELNTEDDFGIEVDVDLSFMDTSGQKPKEAFFLLKDPSGSSSGPFSRSQLYEMFRSGDITTGDMAMPVSEMGVADPSQDSKWIAAGLVSADLDALFEEKVAPTLRNPTRTFNLQLDPAAKVFVEMAIEAQHGLLVFDRPGLHKKIVITNGHPIFASSNLIEEQLGPRLVRSGRIKQSDLEKGMAQSLGEKLLFPDALSRLGLVHQSALTADLNALVQERLVQLFEWRKGHALFYRGAFAAAAPYQANFDLLTLFTEGVRRWAGLGGLAGWLREHEDRTLILSGEPSTGLEVLGLPGDQLDFLERFFVPMSVREVIEEVVLEHLDDEKVAFSVLLALNVGYLAIVAE
jgi:serine/threonine protein kinase